VRELAPGRARVWLSALEPAGDVRAAPRSLDAALSEAERQRRTARVLRDEVLAEATGVPTTNLRLHTDPFGRPALEEHHRLDFNVSHAAQAVAIAVVADGRVGVDIERVRPIRRRQRFRHAFADHEWAAIGDAPDSDAELLRLWTAKEALLKAIGVGLTVAPSQVLGGAHRLGGVLRLDPPAGIDTPERTWTVWPLEALPGYVGSCAVSSGPLPPQVLLRPAPSSRS
jgi:4'-phosphopantetheinyl transferase